MANLLDLYRCCLRETLLPMNIFDANMKVVFCNNAFADLYGFGNQDKVFDGMRYLYSANDDYFPGLMRDLRDPRSGRWEGEVQFHTKNGRLLKVILIVVSLHSKGGKVIGYHSTHINLTKRHQEEERIKREVYTGLSLLSACRDKETGAHQQRISLYADLLSREVGLSTEAAEQVRIFSAMHDIGKIGIPDEILLAPRALSEAERHIMQTHTTLGFDLFKDQESMQIAALIAKHHHEWWNGDGYPSQLKGGKIPLEARITAIADVYDALRSDRPYKRCWSHGEASELILRSSGHQFDPDLVGVFRKLEGAFERVFESTSELQLEA